MLACGWTKQNDFAQELGISLNSMTAYAAKGKVPEWQVLVKIAEKLNTSVDWLLTGQEPTGQDAPPAQGLPPGHGLLRLPRGDPRPLTGDEADRLERALAILRAQGEAEHFAKSLANNIDSFHKALLLTQSQATASEPGRGKKTAG